MLVKLLLNNLVYVCAFRESSSRDCLIYGMYALILMFQLNVVDSNVNIEGCPDRCKCSLANCSYGNGTSSVCVWRGLKNYPMGLLNDTCALSFSL